MFVLRKNQLAQQATSKGLVKSQTSPWYSYKIILTKT